MQDKTHYISVTGIIRKGDKYLICKRSENESAFAGKWCVPGGKIEQKDFSSTPKDTSSHWLGVFEKVLKKEVKEETNLEIKNIGYVSNLAFLRPNGYSTIVVSLHADHLEGDVQVDGEELVDHAWVSVDEAKEYDLIENIWEQIKLVDERVKTNTI